MTYTTMAQMHLSGLPGILIYIANAWSGFTPLVLFVIFMFVLLGSYFAGLRIKGDGNFPGAMFIASLFTGIITTFFSLLHQTVNGVTYTMIHGAAGGITVEVVIAVFIISTLVFFFS